MNKNIAAVLGLSTLLASCASMVNKVEEPSYTVEQAHAGFEVRRYAPRVVAETTVPGPADQAGNQAFKVLAGYIFGNNKGDQKIAMTAPVTQTAESVRIAMTAPVTQSTSGQDGDYVVRFTMPASYTLATLPEPLDPKVQLRELPPVRMAAIKYTGRWTDENYDEHLKLLRERMAQTGLAARGEPVYARYDAPYVPWFMRRNEIWLELAPSP